MGASLNRGESAQDIETPDEFIDAVASRFGNPKFDLAATEANKKAEWYYGPGSSLGEDSLAMNWSRIAWVERNEPQRKLLWLNPPFDPIEPWVAKCAEEYQRGARILLLCRGSIDSNWWWQYIQPNAVVYALTPRIKFVGQAQGYPSPLVLCTFNVLGVPGGPIQRWRWR